MLTAGTAGNIYFDGAVGSASSGPGNLRTLGPGQRDQRPTIAAEGFEAAEPVPRGRGLPAHEIFRAI